MKHLIFFFIFGLMFQMLGLSLADDFLVHAYGDGDKIAFRDNEPGAIDGSENINTSEERMAASLKLRRTRQDSIKKKAREDQDRKGEELSNFLHSLSESEEQKKAAEEFKIEMETAILEYRQKQDLIIKEFRSESEMVYFSGKMPEIKEDDAKDGESDDEISEKDQGAFGPAMQTLVRMKREEMNEAREKFRDQMIQAKEKLLEVFKG